MFELRLANYKERICSLFDRTLQQGKISAAECERLKEIVGPLSYSELTALMACSAAITMAEFTTR